MPGTAYELEAQTHRRSKKAFGPGLDSVSGRARRLVVALAGLGALGVTGLVADFYGLRGDRRSQLRLEVGKGLVHMLLVVVVGAAVKLGVDRYQEQQESQQRARQTLRVQKEQGCVFRQDKYDRLVKATNSLRTVPVLIEAHRTIEVWSAQMLAVMDAGLALRLIKHQVASSRDLPSPPFPDHREIVHLLRQMYRYTDWVTDDFADRYHRLLELAQAARKGWHFNCNRDRQRLAVWSALRQLPSIADLRQDVGTADRQELRQAIMADLQQALGPGQQPSSERFQPPSWAAYQEAERLVLERITLGILADRAEQPQVGQGGSAASRALGQ